MRRRAVGPAVQTEVGVDHGLEHQTAVEVDTLQAVEAVEQTPTPYEPVHMHQALALHCYCLVTDPNLALRYAPSSVVDVAAVAVVVAAAEAVVGTRSVEAVCECWPNAFALVSRSTYAKYLQ